MAKKSITELKEYFKAGKRPTEGQFGDFIDSYIHLDALILPENVATVDKPDLSLAGNTYTKEQIEEKLTNVSGSSYLGELPKSFSFPTTGSYTFHPNETGIYIINGVSLSEITDDDFSNYSEIIIRVTNGLPNLVKVPKAQLSVKNVFDPVDNVNPATMKSTDLYLFGNNVSEITTNYLIEKDPSRATAAPYSTIPTTTNYCWLFNDLAVRTENKKYTAFTIYIVKAGRIIFEKFAVSGTAATRITYEEHIIDSIGYHVVYIASEEMKVLKPNEKYGVRMSSNSGMFGFLFASPEGYSTYFTQTTAANYTLGVNRTDFIVAFKAIEEGQIVPIKGKVNTAIEDYLNKKVNIPLYTQVSQISTEGRTRNDGASLFRLSNGTLLNIFSSFTGVIENDSDPSVVRIKSSLNNGYTWEDYSVLPLTGRANQAPVLYYVGSTLHCIYEKKISVSPLKASICMRSSTDQGLTWGNETELYNNGGYVVQASRSPYLHNGVLFYPFSVLISGNGGDTSSTYHGRLLKSTDGGNTWADGGVEIISTTPMSVEGGFYTNKAGNLVYYFRTREGVVRGHISSDHGITFGAGHTILANVPGTMSSVKKLNNFNKWIAVHSKTENTAIAIGGFKQRKNLLISTSNDGDTFTVKKDIIIYSFNNVDVVKEPQIWEDRLADGIFITYTKLKLNPGSNDSDPGTGQDYYDTIVCFVPYKDLL
ncbi:exo-alpha-sialidase [Chryseobacterium sp. CT-SW4]|uniref:exo-alpha-sialidase n=1 Tax=Chryseobacterium sp. SW-1 TaxID=3157343 RepID=UPI003B029599